jgi:hypothetical protein
MITLNSYKDSFNEFKAQSLQLTEANSALDVIILGLKGDLEKAEQTMVTERQEGVESTEAIKKQLADAVNASGELKRCITGYESRIEELETSLLEINDQFDVLQAQGPSTVAAASESTPFKIPAAIVKEPSVPGSSSSLRHVSDFVDAKDGVSDTPRGEATRRDSEVFGSPAFTDSSTRRESAVSDVLTASDSRRESASLEVDGDREGSIKNRSPAAGVKRASSSVEALKSDAAEYGSSPSSAKRSKSSPVAGVSQGRKARTERVFVCFSGVSDPSERQRLLTIVQKMPNAEYLECKDGLDERISKYREVNWQRISSVRK